ncbi:MAG: response regulator [Sphingobium sp.]|jgi:FixJ family two-component response regulator|nr:MAG: response regulator [Stutzerimonas stutzeri]
MTPGGQSSKRPRILIVEDDAGMRRSMQLLLQGRGFDVRAYAAADPMLLDEELTEAVCLVVDYLLGDRDGISVLGTLRNLGWRGPAILITAYPTEELRRSASEAGFSAFLEKPFKEHMLVNTVASLAARFVGGD